MGQIDMQRTTENSAVVSRDPAMQFSHSLKQVCPPDAISLDEFRKGMRALAGAVTVLTTADKQTRMGLTATAVCSLSAQPPRLLACVNQRGATFELMKRTGHFVVNALSEDQTHIAQCFAGFDLSVSDRFALGQWEPGRYRTGPVLMGTVCAFECEISEIVDACSHGVIIADIKSVYIGSGSKPLLYADGAFSTLATPFVDPRYALQF